MKNLRQEKLGNLSKVIQIGTVETEFKALLGYQTLSILNQRPQIYQVSYLGSLKAETIMTEEM